MVEAHGGDVILNDNEPSIQRAQGKRLRRGDRATITNLQGELYGYAHDGATVEVNPTNFTVEFFPREEMSVGDGEGIIVLNPDGEQIAPARAAPQGNWNSLLCFSESVGTSASSLPSNAVPDGVMVTLQADHENAGDVHVGNSNEQAITLNPGQSIDIAVQNTGSIFCRADETGESVSVIAEVNE